MVALDGQDTYLDDSSDGDETGVDQGIIAEAMVSLDSSDDELVFLLTL